MSELRKELKKNNITILNEIGLVGKASDLTKIKSNSDLEKIIDYLPREFSTSFLFIPYPELATEVLILGEKKRDGFDL